jgi:acyl carrier protein
MEERVRQVLSDVLGVPGDALGPGTSMKTLPVWDSLRHMKIVLALEAEFDHQFDESEIAAITSFEGILSALRKLAP